MDQSFADKVALVTGAGSGMGLQRHRPLPARAPLLLWPTLMNWLFVPQRSNWSPPATRRSRSDVMSSTKLR
jgi:hypothetical protein